ncbi:MAG: trimethylamine corrinoid protein 2, partial [Candidatus Brocadiia bacterium]
MFTLKPDYEKVLARYEAWWECEIVDRPLVSITFPRPERERQELPEKAHTSYRERWLDTQYIIDRTVVDLNNQVFYADALPAVFPNL